ncbi:glycoprotein 3-alpha-L-fucosyltransferase A-like isoform X1 [Silene latifolia]|uniref:glycoprotein 3-alpha-L-fucosyltransferase A-like isoform X1 n=1 Tax=Silene latifolia TaxID=37657 RepID=UPI003D76DE5A
MAPKPAAAAGNDNSSNSRKKCYTAMPIFIALVVIAEIAFLGRLDMAKNAALVNSWADSLLNRHSSPDSAAFVVPQHNTCETWLLKQDALPYSRNFDKDPVLVAGAEQDWNSCSVGCKFGYEPGKKADAAFGWPQEHGTASILRSMESAQYYAENNIANARRRGYDIIMTTSLSSDVPVGYFSWSEYDIMAPVQQKTEKALAAAFISNCGARNFRLQALEGLEKSGITIDSYGGCHRNRDGRVDKVEALKHYRFSLAFENSNEEDYVTEKFFQSLVAGTVPVVVGAPNIEDFAPSPGSVLHIKEIDDIAVVAKKMNFLAENPDAYNQSLRWKYEGPSDSFKALVDMAAVHSSCRLCILLATRIRENEEKSVESEKRPCKCSQGSETIYHVYVRERGTFEMESIFLRSSNLTLEALKSAVLKKFDYLRHVPIWKPERPESIRGNNLRVYKIYPLGLTQRQALYSFTFPGPREFRSHIEANPCSKFEVIFV